MILEAGITGAGISNLRIDLAIIEQSASRSNFATLRPLIKIRALSSLSEAGRQSGAMRRAKNVKNFITFIWPSRQVVVFNAARSQTRRVAQAV